MAGEGGAKKKKKNYLPQKAHMIQYGMHFRSELGVVLYIEIDK